MADINFRQPVKLHKRDMLLIKWLHLASVDDPRKVNYLVKQALISYIRDSKIVLIGKIHAVSELDLQMYPESDTLYLWTKDSEILQDWILQLKSSNVNVSRSVREIIRRSIAVIPMGEEEWIADYYDFVDYRVPIIAVQSNIEPVAIEAPNVSNLAYSNTVIKEQVVSAKGISESTEMHHEKTAAVVPDTVLERVEKSHSNPLPNKERALEQKKTTGKRSLNLTSRKV